MVNKNTVGYTGSLTDKHTTLYLHIVLQVVACAVVLLGSWEWWLLLAGVNPWSLLLLKAGSAEDGTGSEQKSCWNESNVNGSSWFVLVAFWDCWVQKIWNDLSCVPGCWYQPKYSCQDEEDASCEWGLAFGVSVPSQAGALHPNCGNADPKGWEDAWQNHGGPCCLNVNREGEDGIFQGAAKHPSAVPCAVHPEPLHLSYGSDDIGAHICIHLPVGQQGGCDCPEDAQQS